MFGWVAEGWVTEGSWVAEGLAAEGHPCGHQGAEGWATEDSAAEGWAEAAEDVCERTGWGAEQVRPDQPLNQKAVSAAIDQAMFKALLAAATPFNKARLLSASGKGAGAWLGVIPSAELGYVFDPASSPLSCAFG